ncbi:hypothetical protein QJQ45_000185 [Haematococcus lacustris]|nr:hypothetical protein QJQ45_000185 [Haematococcus lacustris]
MRVSWQAAREPIIGAGGVDAPSLSKLTLDNATRDQESGQLVADQLDRWKLSKGQHLAAASSAGTSLVANLKHITVAQATWDVMWEMYLDPKWARQRLRLYGAQDRALEQFFKQVRVSGPKGAGQLRGRVVLVHELRTTRVSSAVNDQQPYEEELDHEQPTRHAGAPSRAGKGKAAKAKPAPQPGRWLDRDCNAALNMQRIGESRWRPLELCWWPDSRRALPAKGKEYPGLGYKRLRDKPPKAHAAAAAAACCGTVACAPL